MTRQKKTRKKGNCSRREFLLGALGAGIAASGSSFLLGSCTKRDWRADSFIARVSHYEANIASVLLEGFRELGVEAGEIKGKRILLKPNLIEPHVGAGHINTHPNVVRGAAEAFLRFGASEVLVAEGPGHSRDSVLVLEESGLGDVLVEDRIPFADLNYEDVVWTRNRGRTCQLDGFFFPKSVIEADLIVSMAKMKTHHWAQVSLSLKNLLGLFSGARYGWPKNFIHFAGIPQAILGLYQVLPPVVSLVDGIVGMEGDGPLFGNSVAHGVLVAGKDPVAVDMVGKDLMGFDTWSVDYLNLASWAGIGQANRIEIRGESLQQLRRIYQKPPKI